MLLSTKKPATISDGIDWSRPVMIAVALVPTTLIFILLLMMLDVSLKSSLPGEVSLHTARNYVALIADPYYFRVFLTTVKCSLITIGVSVPLGLLLGWVVERTNLPCKALARSLLGVGILFPTYFTAMGWIYLLHPRIGVINILLSKFLGSGIGHFNIATETGIGFVQGLISTPLTFAMLATDLRSLNPDLLEAAEVHGLTTIRVLWKVELPLIWPALISASIWTFTISLASFDVPAIIGMPNNIFTLGTEMYIMANPPIGLPQYGRISAFGVLVVALSYILMIPYFKALSHRYRYESVSGKSYQRRVINLGLIRFLGWVFITMYVLLAFILPVLALMWISFKPQVYSSSWVAFAYLLRSGTFGRAVSNTLLLVLAVPSAVVVLSIAVAWIATRSQLRWRLVLDAIAFLPHPMPSIVLAISLSYLAIVISTIPLYGSLYLMAIAYTLCWVSFGTRLIGTNMLQVHRELEEAGFTAGISTFRITQKIIAPIVSPAIRSCWLWIALKSYRELTIAAVLSTPNNNVVSTLIWNTWHEGRTRDAAVIALLMTGALFPLLFLGWWYEYSDASGAA